MHSGSPGHALLPQMLTHRRSSSLFSAPAEVVSPSGEAVEVSVFEVDAWGSASPFVTPIDAPDGLEAGLLAFNFS